MKRVRSLSSVLLVVILVLAGCLGAGADEAPATSSSKDGEAVPFPALSGSDARDFIASYVMTHPFRADNDVHRPFMETARDDLEALLAGMGHDVVRHTYADGVNILAIQPGTETPDQWVVLSAHYDSVGIGTGTTIYGAWDNGAGIGALLEIADALGEATFPFTVVYAFFDGEEKGLLGSGAFVADHIDQVELVANLNMDPPGLNWPCGDADGPFPVKLIYETASADPRYAWLYGAIEEAVDLAGVPEDARDYTPGVPVARVAGIGLTGQSDHVSFGKVNVANAFVGGLPVVIANGDPNEHTAAVITYPLHTPLDTLDAMEARCVTGSLAEGLQTTVDIVGHTVRLLAERGIPVVS